jgi:hypothetical protein
MCIVVKYIQLRITKRLYKVRITMEITFDSFMNDGGENADYLVLKKELIDNWPKRDFAYWGGEDRSIWGMAYSHNRDSDLAEESNWDSMIKLMTRHNSRSIQIILCNHWACGWIEYMLINTNHKKAMYRLYGILGRLEDYPILDDEDLSNREWEQAQEAYDNWASYDVNRLSVMNDITPLLDENGDYDPTEEQIEVIKGIVADCILDYNPGEGTFQDTALIAALQIAFPDPEDSDPVFIPDLDTLTLALDWAC